jgi:hypothetical protein
MKMLGKLAKRWAMLTVAVPVAAAGARKLSELLERKQGPSKASTMLRKSADTLQRLAAKMPGSPRVP